MGTRVFGLGLLMIAGGLMGSPPQVSAAELKIGFVNIQKAITETKSFKKSQMKFRVELKKEKGIIEARKTRKKWKVCFGNSTNRALFSILN